MLGEPFDSYKKKVQTIMIQKVEKVLEHIKKGDHPKDCRNNKKDVESNVRLFLNNYARKNFDYFEQIIWVYQYCDISINEIKQMIVECFNEISFDEPMVVQEQKQAYFDFRRINAEMPSVEDFISAYETTLIAQGVKSKKERNKIIRETLKVSAVRANSDSYFFKKGIGKSEAQRVFDKMSFGLSTFFNKD